MNTPIRVSMRGVSEQAFGSRCADGLYRDFVTHPAATQAIYKYERNRELWIKQGILGTRIQKGNQ